MASRQHAPCQRDFLTSYSSATRHEWLYLFSTRHECFTRDAGLTRTRLVSRVFLTSLLLGYDNDTGAVRDSIADVYQDNVALVKQLKIVSLELRWVLQVAEIVFRCNHGSAPSALIF